MSRKAKPNKADQKRNMRALIHARVLLKLSTSLKFQAVVAAVARELQAEVPATKVQRYALLVAFTSGADAQTRIAEWKAQRGVSKAQYYARRSTKPQAPRTDVTGIEFLQTYEWRALRMRVLKRYGSRCQCCGATPNDGVRMHVDHIKPRRLFPELALEETNLQVLCEECNHGKGNWDQTDWRPFDPPTADEEQYRPLWWKPVVKH